MKKLLIAICFVAFTAISAFAQIKTPAASPSAKTMQTVGLTEVTIEYSRPSAKGRTIFGADALVPNGKLWRTGANAVTQITFSDNVMIEGKELKGGKYGVLTTPDASKWTVSFYPFESGSWSSYKEATPALSVDVMPKSTNNHVESFTISVDDLKMDGATLNMAWAKTIVPLSISTSADKTVMANIEKVMAGPSAGDYYNAASYYYESGKDINQALAWMEKATAGKDKRYWQIKKLSEIYAKAGKIKDAIRTAKTALELATKAGNADYVKMLKNNINKWSK